MKQIIYLFLITLIAACSSPKTPENLVSIPQTVDFKARWDTVRVLKNPHKGWYHHLLDFDRNLSMLTKFTTKCWSAHLECPY